MVDTAATYSVFPRDLLERLQIKAIDTATFELGDGRVVDWQIGSVDVRIDGKERPTLCVFGELGVPALLGAVTLENFLLAVDPVHKRLTPVRGYILAIHSPGA